MLNCFAAQCIPECTVFGVKVFAIMSVMNIKLSIELVNVTWNIFRAFIAKCFGTTLIEVSYLTLLGNVQSIWQTVKDRFELSAELFCLMATGDLVGNLNSV